MIDILLAVISRRTCPWCRPMPDTYGRIERVMSVIYKRGPRRLVILLFKFDNIVFHIGGGWHRRFHIKEISS